MRCIDVVSLAESLLSDFPVSANDFCDMGFDKSIF